MSNDRDYVDLSEVPAELKILFDSKQIGAKFLYPTTGNQYETNEYEIVADSQGVKRLVNKGTMMDNLQFQYDMEALEDEE